MVPVFGWASWPVKEIVAPWPVFQADPIEGIGGRRRTVRSTGFRPGEHRMTYKRGSCIRRFLGSCGRVREVCRRGA